MNREIRDALIFIFPLFFFVTIFLFLPVLGTFWVSLWHDVSFLPGRFVGLFNYLRLFKDNQFWQSTIFTLLFSLTSVALELALGVIIALVVNERLRFRGLVRGIALLPWAIPSVIGARIWQLIYKYDYGVLNYTLQKLFGVSVNWLGTGTGAFLSLVMADVWRTTPFVAVIFLAGLQTVPEELYQQAKIDGTNFLQRFFKITVPMIKPIFVVALLFRTIDALRVFDVIYIITGGGPAGSTDSISLYSYKYFALSDFGYGSAISVSLFIIAFASALIFMRMSRFKEVV